MPDGSGQDELTKKLDQILEALEGLADGMDQIVQRLSEIDVYGEGFDGEYDS